jgi:DNA-binding CsgD family transcriptional regulator
MTKSTNLTTVDLNSIIYRVNEGIKLVKPGNTAREAESGISFDTGHTVASLLQQPFNFYFLNPEGTTLHMNQPCVEICGFSSIKDSLGKSLVDVSTSETATKLIENCKEVITENKIKIFEEENLRNDGISMQFLSVKSPWYNDANEIIGLFGCSIVLGKQSLAAAILQISELGLLNSTNYTVNNTIIPAISPNNKLLSERESLCLFHLCKGYTLKEIAKIIGLSPKTIETYIDRAKQKFKSKNKSELIAAYLKATQ